MNIRRVSKPRACFGTFLPCYVGCQCDLVRWLFRCLNKSPIVGSEYSWKSYALDAILKGPSPRPTASNVSRVCCLSRYGRNIVILSTIYKKKQPLGHLQARGLVETLGFAGGRSCWVRAGNRKKTASLRRCFSSPAKWFRTSSSKRLPKLYLMQGGSAPPPAKHLSIAVPDDEIQGARRHGFICADLCAQSKYPGVDGCQTKALIFLAAL